MKIAMAMKPHRVRVEALGDVLGAQAGADGAFLDDLHRRSQRAGPQQQGGVGGFFGAHAAGDLHPAAADLAADHRGGHDLALALLDQQDGHALVDVLAGDVPEDAGAGGVEGEVHRRLVVLAVEARLGVGEALAGQDHLLLDQQRAAAALGVELGARPGRCPASAPSRAPGVSSTMRISRVAVRPRMSLALATSCTPGSCTTMRSRPCCWITGSATPSSLIRLCRVPMFCLSAGFLDGLLGQRA